MTSLASNQYLEQANFFLQAVVIQEDCWLIH